MPNSNYNRGRAYEYKAKKELEVEGYSVIRAAGSHGPWDLVAIPRDASRPVRCIQIKVTKVPAAIKLLVSKFTDSLHAYEEAAQPTQRETNGSFVCELWVWHSAKWNKFTIPS